MSGALQNNPTMSLFNQMMSGKTRSAQMQTLLNSAKSRGLDINQKIFSEADLKALGLK
jgi:hypothetical protein